ncbi:MAG TPA: GIY-YIG nuclease family protein [Vicinamibacterales bacterium]|nr:GIY-YIG nuclease family protein [Vicinamibacterales bacterium]
MPYVYLLRCADNSLYTGQAENLEARLARHNMGTASAFTARRRPVRLVYSEALPTPALALARERQLKRWTRAKKEALIAGDLIALKRL